MCSWLGIFAWLLFHRGENDSARNQKKCHPCNGIGKLTPENCSSVESFGFMPAYPGESRSSPGRFRRNTEKQTPRLREYFSAHPAIQAVYDFFHELTDLLCTKGKNRHDCATCIPAFLHYINKLHKSPFKVMRTMGTTLASWKEEVAIDNLETALSDLCPRLWGRPEKRNHRR